MWLPQPYSRCLLPGRWEGGRFDEAGEADSDMSMESDNHTTGCWLWVGRFGGCSILGKWCGVEGWVEEGR